MICSEPPEILLLKRLIMRYEGNFLKDWVNNDFEKAMFLLELRDYPSWEGPIPRVLPLFEKYPEIATMPYWKIGTLIGMARETVNRAIVKHFGVYRCRGKAGHEKA